MATVYIALGSNLGDRGATIQRAAQRLIDAFGPVNMSSLFETEPVGYADQPSFLNAVARVETSLGPHEVLTTLQDIERELGRERPFPNAPRTLDLDLLLYDDLVLDSPDLTIPHPRMHERFFVLVPLAELVPHAVHPRLRKSVSDLLDELGTPRGIQRYRSP